MEAVEFYIIDGVTCINRNGVSQKLTPQDRDCIEYMMENIGKYFPDAMKAIKKWAAASKMNKFYYEYRIVDRFIRCNFGEADFLHKDIDDLGLFHLEEVKCPMRTICEHEGVICKPKANLNLSEEEKKAAGLYAKGLLPGEIAVRLGKSESTIKRQLYNAYKRLNLPHPRWLIRLFSVYNITT